MRHKLTPMLLAAALAAPALLRAAPPSPLSPEAPEPAAAALVDAYLPLLAVGEFDRALALTDLRGMRQYLLDRRLADLRTRNPELTAQDLDEISAQLQTNELNPARLQAILMDMMKEAGYEGMSWQIRGYASLPGADGAHLVGIDARTPDGREKPVWIGLRKLGEQWRIAPDVVEAIGRRQTAVRLVPRDDVPGAAAGLVQAFWTRWQSGDLNEAYALMGAAYRSRVALLDFLQQAQDFLGKAGIPAEWQIVQGLESAPGTLAVGVNVQGSTTTLPTLMVFKKTGETWVLEDLQLQMPRIVPGGNPPSPAPRSFRTDLKPDLSPAIGPVPPPSDPEPSAPSPGEVPPATPPPPPESP